MVSVDRYRYGCARAKDRGPSVCASRLHVPRAAVEDALLAGIRADLLSDEAYKRFERETRALLAQGAPDATSAERALRDAERVRDNVMTAIRAGIITPSTRAELVTAERAVERAKSELDATRAYQPAQILPRARETWRRLVSQLSDVRDVPEARSAIRELLGDAITLTMDATGAVIAETAQPDECQIAVVAGARSGRYLTQRLRIVVPLPGRRL